MEAEATELRTTGPHLATLHRPSADVGRAGAAGGQPDRAGQLAALGLTPRQREVLDWVGAGKTNRDIGAILGASPRTIEKHLERIYEKLGVETRTAAAMRVLRLMTFPLESEERRRLPG